MKKIYGILKYYNADNRIVYDNHYYETVKQAWKVMEKMEEREANLFSREKEAHWHWFAFYDNRDNVVLRHYLCYRGECQVTFELFELKGD